MHITSRRPYFVMAGIGAAMMIVGAYMISAERDPPTATPTAAAPSAQTPTPMAVADRHRGVSWVAGGEISKDDLLPLVENHVNWIVQTPFGWQRNISSTEIGLATSNVLWGETDEGLTITTAMARELGIKTMLKPHIWLRDQSNGAWRGTIQMANDEDWRAWFNSYETLIVHYALLAEKTGMEALCIGTELRSTLKRETEWRRIIARIKSVYHGKLTYAANWYAEFEEVPFWDELDYIGIQGYFPLANHNAPSLETLTEAWRPHIGKIQTVQERYGKPVIFTEFGYRSMANAAIQPWEWISRNERVEPDVDTQARCYRAFFEAFSDVPWFAGTYIWKWFPRHDSAGGNAHPGFTPQNKPAEAIIAQWYGRDAPP